jgi:hydrogenase nickel incorporation protein HypA/HybF
MHELGITRNLVAIVGDAAKGRAVRKVWLEIGSRSALMPEAVRFCFDVVSKGTVLEDAELEIVQVSPGWQCTACGVQLGGTAQSACSECGCDQLRLRTGDELNIKSMEVESCV